MVTKEKERERKRETTERGGQRKRDGERGNLASRILKILD